MSDNRLAGLAVLADRLTREMSADWHDGRRRPAESYLVRHPELFQRPDAAVRLVFEEVCLRQEQGEDVSCSELVRRFPKWSSELEIMLECDRLMQAVLSPSEFPQAGDCLGEFRLLAELGRGGESRVYLATQPSLADRPVVLKVTSGREEESLSLARLQHTHIIPLHGVHDFPQTRLRGLCQPYLGGATLEQVQAALAPVPMARRTGRTLIDALDHAAVSAPLTLPVQRGPRDVLAQVSYEEAVCWIGACLADALHYAHERGLVHYDVKPSNVLLAADGQPLLLDFHLALPPLFPAEPAPACFGGTLAYMSPEQQRAWQAVNQGQPIPEAVDGRCDIYALGCLLYGMLTGDGAPPTSTSLPLHRRNPRVSVGLSDIVQKCLAPVKEKRYPEAKVVAEDLRRHLAHEPLRGVRNRSGAERWRKWRQRRPDALLRLMLLLAMAVTICVIAMMLAPRLRPASPRMPLVGEPSFHAGRNHLQAGDLEQAALALSQATERRPQDVEAHFLQGLCAHRQGRYEEAILSFSVAIALAPQAPEPRFNRALAYAARGMRREALRDYDRVLTLSPTLGAAWLNRGILHLQNKHYSQAQADFALALQNGADASLVHYNLALLHDARQETEAARRHVARALACNPDLAEARRLRDRLGASSR